MQIKGSALLWALDQLIRGHGLSKPLLCGWVGSMKVRVTSFCGPIKRRLDGLITGILRHTKNIVRRYRHISSQNVPALFGPPPSSGRGGSFRGDPRAGRANVYLNHLTLTNVTTSRPNRVSNRWMHAMVELCQHTRTLCATPPRGAPNCLELQAEVQRATA